VNAFHVIGACAAIWALLVSFLGITRENFPGSPGAERLVGAISILLVVGAISAAIITSADESHEEEGGKDAAAVLPL
jgi:hypothetical protein